MRAELSDGIVSQFRIMEEQGMVNPGVRDSLVEYRALLDAIKDRILKAGDDRVSFHYYHALHSCDSIIEKMLERLEKSQTTHGNPQMVLDAIALFPSINKMIDLVDVPNVDRRGADDIVYATFELTKLARRHGLVTSMDENVKSMDTEFINDRLGGLVSNI